MPSPSRVSVSFHSTLMTQWLPQTVLKLDRGTLTMATDIHRRAAILAPKASRALVNSGRVQRRGIASYSIIFGSNQVRYARYRHYVNNRNPGSLRYLERAGDGIARGNNRHYFA